MSKQLLDEPARQTPILYDAGVVVVGGADEDEVVDVGVAVGWWCEWGEVVGFAVGWCGVADDAALVADDQLVPLVVGGEAFGAALPHHGAFGVVDGCGEG